MNSSEIKLLVFLTRGGSLELWARKGIIAREIQLYEEIQKFGISTTLLTYGNASEKKYAELNRELRVKFNSFNLPLRVYEKAIPLLQCNEILNAQVVKTNQMNGAVTALGAARLWRKPLIARCGYMWSLNLARSIGYESPESVYARKVESKVFSQSSVNVLTTQEMVDDVKERILDPSDCVVIPNFVDINRFKPDNAIRKDTDVLFVGRIIKEKNLVSLTKSFKGTKYTLKIIGDGDKSDLFDNDAHELGDRVNWVKYVEHALIANYMNQARIFVLPSLYEGHPKALLEAMASGMAVIGADSPGINNVIIHGETGWLCGTRPENFRQSINELLNKPELMSRLGENARQFVRANYSLSAIGRTEAELIRRVVEEN